MFKVTSFGKFESALRDKYCERLKRLIPFQWNEIPVRQMPSERPTHLLPEESKFLSENKSFGLIDVLGKDLDSKAFQKFVLGSQDRHLVVGPAIGFHPDFFERAEFKIKLSSLTLTHELAQIVLAENLYRAVCMEWNHPFAK